MCISTNRSTPSTHARNTANHADSASNDFDESSIGLKANSNKGSDEDNRDTNNMAAINDWVLVATIVDRLCCISFGIVVIIMTIVIFSF